MVFQMTQSSRRVLYSLPVAGCGCSGIFAGVSLTMGFGEFGLLAAAGTLIFGADLAASIFVVGLACSSARLPYPCLALHDVTTSLGIPDRDRRFFAGLAGSRLCVCTYRGNARSGRCPLAETVAL